MKKKILEELDEMLNDAGDTMDRSGQYYTDRILKVMKLVEQL